MNARDLKEGAYADLIADRERGRTPMEVSCRFAGTRSLEQNLTDRVIGQDAAIERLVCSYARLLSGLRDPSRPLLTVLLLGPTGVGKTETAKALAETLLGSELAMTRVNGEEYAHGHEVSKLIGAPPGYVGYDTEPLLSQRRIDRPHRRLRSGHGSSSDHAEGPADEILRSDPDKFLSVLLFDEIEKAHPVVWNALLGILEDGQLTLGNNSTTDFTRSIIVMTSNVGSWEMGEILDGRQIGFASGNGSRQSEAAAITEAVQGAARKLFPLEFLNRFDETLVYSALRREHLERIFDKFLADIHARAIHHAGLPVLIKVAPEARALIIDRAIDPRFGARPLRRAMERDLVDSLSRLIASHELDPGDVVEVERNGDQLVFYRQNGAKAGLVL